MLHLQKELRCFQMILHEPVHITFLSDFHVYDKICDKECDWSLKTILPFALKFGTIWFHATRSGKQINVNCDGKTF